MEFAFSTEIDDFVQADEARDLFEDGLIVNNQAFVCPGDNCSAETTCVNLYRPATEIKKAVHFRVKRNDDHSEDCPWSKENSGKKKKGEDEGSTDPYKNSQIVNFILRRPKDYYTKRKPKAEEGNKDYSELKNQKRHNRSDLTPTNLYSVKSLANRFLRIRRTQKTLDNTFARINGKVFSFSELFVHVSETNFGDLPSSPRIYYGDVYVNLKTIKGNENVELRFGNGFLGDDQENRITTIFFKKSRIDEEEKQPQLKSRINKVIDSRRPESVAFIYGEPRMNVKDGKEYINFSLATFDFLDLIHHSNEE
jgi:hypothetical protein